MGTDYYAQSGNKRKDFGYGFLIVLLDVIGTIIGGLYIRSLGIYLLQLIVISIVIWAFASGRRYIAFGILGMVAVAAGFLGTCAYLLRGI